MALGNHKRSNDFRRGMHSWPLDSTNGWMMSGVESHHRPWATHMVEPNLPMEFSLHFDKTKGHTTLVVACHNSPWTAQMIEGLRAW